MPLTTAIFDMDGLLIDSEPLWYDAALEVMKEFDIHIDQDAYNTTTGLRTKEFLQHWFGFFQIDFEKIPTTEEKITSLVISKVLSKGEMMDGVEHVLSLVKKQGFKLGLASSSPLLLIEAVLKKTGLEEIFSIKTSAEYLLFGKPHPQVFLNCAEALGSHPTECICFEDSFNGMIAAKAGRMKCILVPHPDHFQQSRWQAADLVLNSLSQLTEKNLTDLNK